MDNAIITDITPYLIHRSMSELATWEDVNISPVWQTQRKIHSLLSHAYRLWNKYSGKDCAHLQCEFAVIALMPFNNEIESPYIIENALLNLLRVWNDGQGKQCKIIITSEITIDIYPAVEPGESMTMRYTAFGDKRLFMLMIDANKISLIPAP